MTNHFDEYWEFNIKAFIRDYKEYEAQLKDLQAALAEIGETKSQNFAAAPGTPGRGDTVPAAAEKSDEIRRKIKEIKPIIQLYHKADRALSDEEKEIIDYLFHRPGMATSNARWLAKNRHMDISTVYRKMNVAIQKMGNAIGVRIKR